MVTLSTLMQDIADAIREKKGISEPINPQDFASEIASIEGGGGDTIGGIVNRVSYLRRTNEGYINTGINGANNNLKIKIQYALRTLPTGYWSLIYAYADENTNTTRIILNKNTQVLGNINSKASGGGVTASRTSYENIIYTDVIEPTSSTTFKLNCNGVTYSKTRTSGNALDKNILIFSAGSDTIDIELYKCEIYDGDTLIRDFVPCIRGTEYGLWDVVTETFYGNNGDGEFSGDVISLQEVESPQPINIKWTGHADVEGLKAIGWDDEDIAYFSQFINWNEEDDDKYKVSDANKAVYEVLTEKNIATYKYDIIYMPKIDTSTRTSFSSYFYNWYWLRGVPMLDTSNATNVSSMFRGCSALLAVPPINTSKATNVSRLFDTCRNLTRVPWIDTSKATNMASMFLSCSLLTEIPEIDTSSAKDMSSLFHGCVALTSIPSIDTSSATNMSSMFNGCYNLISLPNIDTSNATTTASMFYNCYNIKDVPKLDLANATTTASMFYSCTKLSSIPDLVTPKVTTMASMFYACRSLVKAPNLDTTNTTNMSSMFYGCIKLSTIPLYDTSSVTNFTSMFNGCAKLNAIPQMNTSSATTMESMFNACNDLKYIPELDTQNVTTMKNMFVNCFSLYSVPKFNMPKVADVLGTFNSATSLMNVPEFDVANISTSPSTAPFKACYNLINVNVKNIKANITFRNSYLLSKESLLYMIRNAASTSSIVITLNSNTYDKYAEDLDVLEALSFHPNISLAK